MPRKRATRATTASKARPQLRVSANDSIMSKMSYEQRQEKLDKYLLDFDLQAKAHRMTLEETRAGCEALIRQTFINVLQQFTSAERGMTIAEYIAKQEKKAESEEKENTEDLVPVVSNSTALATQMVSKYNRSRRVIDTIPEDATSESVPTVKRTRQCRKKNQTNDDSAPSFVTPATGRTFDPLNPWGNTPLVTPKFDPRLPITPTQKRRALPGETVMSLAGSPIEVSGSSKTGTRARGSTLQIVKKGQTLQLVREGEDKPEMSIEEEELSNIDTMLNSDMANSNIGKMMSMFKMMVEGEKMETNN